MKKRAQRSPFVVTVALATAVTACGGSTFRDDGSGGDGGNAGSSGKNGSGGNAGSGTGGVGAGGSSGSAGNAGVGGSGGHCPTTPTEDGTACAKEEETCHYQRCYAPLWNTLIVMCRDGLWRHSIGGTCNPPVPVCPVDLPPQGTPCSLPADMMCNYETHPCCPPKSARCASGVWEILISTCNPPPPPPCPVDPPAPGSSCAPTDPCGTYPFQECTYGTCPNGAAMTQALCNGDVWMVKSGCAVDAGVADAGAGS
jgi:hypothetical protein